MSVSMTMVVHKVDISLNGEYVVARTEDLDGKPDDLDKEVWKGQKLQINSNQGTHRVVFDPWPFAEKEQKEGIVTSEEFTFERSGSFKFYCYFTPGGGHEHGYDKATGGGHGVVRP
jgi:plastocyanin